MRNKTKPKENAVITDILVNLYHLFINYKQKRDTKNELQIIKDKLKYLVFLKKSKSKSKFDPKELSYLNLAKISLNKRTKELMNYLKNANLVMFPVVNPLTPTDIKRVKNMKSFDEFNQEFGFRKILGAGAFGTVKLYCNNENK